MSDYTTEATSVKTALDAIYLKKADVANNLTTTTSGKALDARQGKALADLIGDAIAYINQQVVIQITNDITTLNGSLQQLGETLANNITSKGVSASASDGLTTLASKVLQISGGGGSSISLSSNKSILSYYDSESATLTATYESGATMELYNADTMTKIGNFTESNGTYTYTYNSTGNGDINLIAKVGSTMSDPILIEDCILAYADEISRTSTYTTDHLTEVFNNFSFTSDSFSFEADVKYTGESVGIAVTPNNANAGYHHLLWAYSNSQQSFYIGRQSSGEETYRYGSISTNTYYSLKVTYENGTVTSYMDGTQKGQYTDRTYLNGETRNLYWYEWNSGRTITAKNIKIKLLNDVTPYSPCTQYITEIENAIEYINGSGT